MAGTIKELYLINKHNRLYEILKMAENSDILHSLDIFKLAINNKNELWHRLNSVLRKSWQDIERQLSFFIYSVCTIITWYMGGALIVSFCDLYKDYENFTPTFTVPAKYPTWSSKGPKMLIYSLQFLNIASVHHIGGIVPLCVDSIFVVVVLHCSALLHILRILIQHSTSVDVPPSIRIPYLLCCIRFYQKIFNYYLTINSLYKHLNLAQYCSSIIILCMIMFQINAAIEVDLSLTIKMLLYLTALLAQNFVYCFNAEKLITQSTLIPLACYDCQWPDETQQFKNLIKMMIMRTNRSMCMRLSGFDVMSMLTLVSFYQKSSSFFLLLQNISGKNNSMYYHEP